VAETRRFAMHPKLLFDVILRQAGNIEKAILEGVMNSVDAGAKQCRITLDQDVVEISDNGSGIQSRQQIEQYFETFGQPHEESEKKVYGTFRMGRGQLFAFGVNVWRTAAFRMEVDIKGKGLDYVLEEGLNPFPGCGVRVELYEKLRSSAIYEAVRVLKQWCKYTPVQVYLNDEMISVDAADEDWDHVLPEAYIRMNESGELSIFNLGVYVCGMPNYRLGTGGVIVSRKQLKMNFARNDIQSDCPVWKVVKPFVDKTAEKKIKSTNRALQSWERERMATKLRQDPVGEYELWDTKLAYSANSRSFSLAKMHPFASLFLNYGGKVARAPKGSILGDRVMQQKLAFVISDETLKHFGFQQSEIGLQGLMDFMKPHVFRNASARKWTICPLQVFEKELGAEAVFLDAKKYTPRVKVWVKFLEYTVRDAMDTPRAIKAGKWPGARAWTDGLTYICFDDRFLRHQPYDLHGISEVLLVLFHEMAHADDTKGSHIHAAEFYEHFEDLLKRKYPMLMKAGPRRIIEAMRHVGLKLTKDATYIEDPADRVREAAEDLQEKCEKTGQPFEG